MKLFRFGQGAGRFNRYLNQGANTLAVMIIFFMMFHITADVAGRYLFNNPIPATYEITEMLMVLVVFLGLGYTQASRSHIRVETVVRFLPPKGQVIAEVGKTGNASGAHVHFELRRDRRPEDPLLYLP